MTAVSDVVRDALEYLGVLDGNEAAEAEDEAVSIRQLNMMMRRWEASGLALGWQDVSNGADTLPAPPEAEQAIGYNLAVRLRPRFGVEIAPDVIELARTGYEALLRDQAVATPIQPILDVPEPDWFGARRFRSTAWDY